MRYFNNIFLDRYTKLLILNNFTEETYYLNDYLNFV